MIPLSPVDELVRQACSVLAQQRYGEDAAATIVPTPPSYLARVELDDSRSANGEAPPEAPGSTPRQALERLLMKLQPGTISE